MHKKIASFGAGLVSLALVTPGVISCQKNEEQLNSDKMISLNVYLTPKASRETELERAIKEDWMAAMETQPGFIRAVMKRPFSDSDLVALEASKAPYAYEVVSYWLSEKQRLEWVARDIHQEVWPEVVEEAESVSYTLFDINAEWNMR